MSKTKNGYIMINYDLKEFIGEDKYWENLSAIDRCPPFVVKSPKGLESFREYHDDKIITLDELEVILTMLK